MQDKNFVRVALFAMVIFIALLAVVTLADAQEVCDVIVTDGGTTTDGQGAEGVISPQGNTVNGPGAFATGTNTNEMGQSQGINYQPQSWGNTSIGSWPGAGGMSVGTPNIPLSWQLFGPGTQWNETSMREFFQGIPQNITRGTVEGAIKQIKQVNAGWFDDGQKFVDKMGADHIVFGDYYPVDEIQAWGMFPPLATKGVDYYITNRTTVRAGVPENTAEVIAWLLLQKSMDAGADRLVVTAQGSQSVFTTEGKSVSVLSALVKIFVGSTSGLNISPNGGISSGSNTIVKYPYVRISGVKIVNADRCIFPPPRPPAKPEPTKPQEIKVDVNLSGLKEVAEALVRNREPVPAPVPEVRVIEVEPEPDPLKPYQDKIDEWEGKLGDCPDLGKNNAGLRKGIVEQALIPYLGATDPSHVKERKGKLKKVIDNLGKLLQNLRVAVENGEMTRREADWQIGWTYSTMATAQYELGVLVTDYDASESYKRQALANARRAGISEIPRLW